MLTIDLYADNDYLHTKWVLNTISRVGQLSWILGIAASTRNRTLRKTTNGKLKNRLNQVRRRMKEGSQLVKVQHHKPSVVIPVIARENQRFGLGEGMTPSDQCLAFTDEFYLGNIIRKHLDLHRAFLAQFQPLGFACKQAAALPVDLKVMLPLENLGQLLVQPAIELLKAFLGWVRLIGSPDKDCLNLGLRNSRGNPGMEANNQKPQEKEQKPTHLQATFRFQSHALLPDPRG